MKQINSKLNFADFCYEENSICLVCCGHGQVVLGQRGNREYSGADPDTFPHVHTNVVKCIECGFIFCNPKIKGLEHLEQDHYNDPDVYQAFLKSNVYSIFQVGKKLLKRFKPSGCLLDVGAGKGDFVSLANSLGYSAKGIEPSARFCDYARKHYGVEVEHGYLGAGNHFKDEKFDIITLFHVLEHVVRPKEFLSEVLKRLKDDGVVYIEVPNADASILWVADRVFRLLGRPWSSRLSPLHAPFHSMGYSPKSLRYILESNGFDLVYADTYSGRVRGYNTSGRISDFTLFIKNLILGLANIFPNRELVCVVARKKMKNLDVDTVKSFGDEWSRFDQAALSKAEANKAFNEYFSVFPWEILPEMATGFDMGCGSGRWAKIMAPRVGHLHCIDPSSSLEVARVALTTAKNVSFHAASVDDSPLPENTQDFGYSLGVLHHVPDTASAIRSCVAMLKPGAPFLVYLYYACDNRSIVFKLIWRCSDLLRRVICKLPSPLKHVVTDTLAVLIYYPLARFALLAERMRLPVSSIPLSYYRNHSLYTMRTDSRDRFGTPLEQRFTRNDIALMLDAAGLGDVRFSENAPFWCAVGIKKS
jgi:2-polyprenyl-3-methyl-5-hydroxy-6-metoxy-1,4-benzoquinol methylase